MLSSCEKKRKKSIDAGSPVALPVGSHSAVSPVGDDGKTNQEEVDEIFDCCLDVFRRKLKIFSLYVGAVSRVTGLNVSYSVNTHHQR
mgnify:CR=1 FL=1